MTADPQLPAPPAWQERAVTRSLGRSRAQAEHKSEQFVATARELVNETDGREFTVQDVVDRMRVSTKTFYQYFSSKDELVVALFEEVQGERFRRLRATVAAEPDPLSRLRAFVITSQLNAKPSGVDRLLVQQYFRLQLNHPAELRHALKGHVAYLSNLIADAARAGAIRTVHHERAAGLILQVVSTAYQASILGSPLVDPAPSPEEVWEFCRSGLLASAPEGS
jgi:AcrR family transcriptional regulator